MSGAHVDSIWRLSWAHPEFGQVSIKIIVNISLTFFHSYWRLARKTKRFIFGRNKVKNATFHPCQKKITLSTIKPSDIVNKTDIESRSRWQRKAQLTESKKSVNDVKFAPRHLGLKLASASGDGFIRIYEASDVFALNFWPLQVNDNNRHL